MLQIVSTAPAEGADAPVMLHGGDLSEAMALHGGDRDDWLDLSTGINPHAWPLPAELPRRYWTALPNRADLEALLDVARRAYAVPAGVAILAAPGTQALIQWLPLIAPEGDVAILGPTYAEHALSWQRAGRTTREVGEAVLPEGVRHVVLVNPNNPDGRLLDVHALAELGEEAARRGGWLIVDESFIDMTPDASCTALAQHLPVIVLRSFGKFHGLAGLRLGFALGPPAHIGRLEAALGPWAVAGSALAIGRMALADGGWARAMRERLLRESARLDAVLARSGTVLGGASLYRLLRSKDAGRLHAHLAASRIWTRRFDWDASLLRFGLPAHDAGLARLAAALETFDAAHHESPQGDSSVSPSTR